MTDVLLPDGPLAFAQDGDDTRRYFHVRDVEWRDSANGQEEYTFLGYASVFGSWSELLWTPKGVFKERFLKGAFEDVLDGPHDVRFLQNHNKDLVLARTKSGTLELAETETALRTWARVAKTSYATDLRLSMQRGDVDQMSVQFEMDYDNGAVDRWYEDKKTGEICHDVEKVSDLYDVSVVTFPAYAETSAVMRDFDRAQKRGLMENYTINTIAPRYKSPMVGLTVVGHERLAYKRCRQAMAETVWAIQPSYLNLFFAILDERAAGHKPTDEEIRERIGIRRDNEPVASGPVAVIPLMGPIMPRAGAMAQTSGVKSLEDFRGQFRQALNDPNVQSIVLDVDSPGGVVDGVPEMAAEIKAARGKKPIKAVANYMAASAAYWIASAADELIVSPSAEVGSVGVFAAHQDRSAELEMKGIKTTFVHAGENKVEYHPEIPLSDDAKEYLQGQVDLIYNDFVGALAKNRGVSKQYVLDNFGQGRMKQAGPAIDSGMADRIGTLDEVLQELQPVVESRGLQIDVTHTQASPAITVLVGDEEFASLELPSRRGTERERDEDYNAELFTPTILKSTAAIPPHNTTVIDKPWDAGANVGRVKSNKVQLRALNAWVDSGADPNLKGSYKFPHHEVDASGTPGPANINGVNNAMARLSNSKIPAGDKAGVKRHLQRHQDAWHAKNPPAAQVAEEDQDFVLEISDELHSWNDLYDNAKSREMRDYLGLVATAETDPSGIGFVAQAETDPAGRAEVRDVASAATDPTGEADSVSVWKARIRNESQRAREAGIRLTKEMLS